MNCYHVSPGLGHCALVACPNYRESCPAHRQEDNDPTSPCTNELPVTYEELDLLDAWGNAFGGLSILLKSDEVMTALAAIPVEAGSECSMADILTSTSANLNDFAVALKKELGNGEGNA